MAVFSNNTGFGAPARPEPRTVTYNSEPISEAMHRSARMGSRVIAQTLGVAAWLLAGVALLMSWSFAASLGVTWGEVVKLCAVATGLVAAMVGLPVSSALMARSYPQESRWAVRAWVVALLAVSAAAMVFTWRLETPGDKGDGARLVARPLAAPPVRSQFMTQAIWRDTAGCSTHRTLYHEMACEEFQHEMAVTGADPARPLVAEAVPSEWTPAATLGITSLADGAARQGIVLLLMLIATGGAGVFGRWAVLATAESYRLGEGQASALPQMRMPAAAPAPAHGPVIMQQDPFSMWASGRLIQEAGATVPADALWADFHETCRLNNLPLQTPNWFFNKMSALAQASGGRIVKFKNDTMHYRGVRLPSGGDMNTGAANGSNQWVN